MAIIKKLNGHTPKFGKNCFLADNAAIIGVVTKGTVVESGWAYAGTPAKKMKQLGEELLKGEVERIVNAYSMYASWYEDENQEAE